VAIQHQRREVQISSRRHIVDLLNAAERDLRAAAVCNGTHGILATRRQRDLYVLELSGQVPYGLTHKRDSEHQVLSAYRRVWPCL
jgi:hypothetical protein